ncbi:MAG TPA: alkaline phosphatase D family protein, partial [Gemmatimonadales bacterium]
MTPNTFEIEVGETQQLVINVENPVGPTEVQSSDTGVATVDSSGLVTGVAEGSVTITATNNGVSDTASGTVTAQEPAEEGDPITLLHGVMGVPSSDSVTIKFKSATNATGVRLAYSTDPAMEEGVQYTEPQDLDDDNYCTFTATLTGLQPDTEYYWAPFAAGELVQRNGVYGRFRTAPVGPASFKLAFGNCNQYSSGTPRDLTVWDHIREQEPAFLVHLDDFHYGDLTTTDVAPRVEADEEQMAMPRQGACYWRVPLVRGMGDHDFCGNDSYGGRGDNPAAGRFAAAEAYRITMPTPTLPHEEGMYYAFTWGRVRFIKLDGRYFRDSRWFTGPDKSMLGTTQKAWFKSELDDAAEGLADGSIALVVVMGDVPWTGSTASDADHWAGYNAERVEIANYIESA